jgi:4-amino-4-deoxy-L-arabinose transferase-like glycosyltransferase
VLAIGIVALVPRLAMIALTPVETPVYDLQEYWDRAVFILENGRLYENSTRMPGYPAALALVLTICQTGPSLEAARFFNMVAGVIAAVLTYWLARRTTGPGWSLAAALIVALYPSFIIYTTFTATEAVVTVPLLAALIAATYRSPGAAVIAGICAAASTLVRPAGVVMLPAVMVAFARPGFRKGWRYAAPRSALVVAAFAVTMLPWWMHNARLHGRFVPLDASGGINMAIGNNPNASGTYRWREARHLYAMNLTPVEVATPASSDRAAAFAMDYIRTHPARFVRLIPAKVAALFALEGRELALLYSLGFFGPREPATVWSWGLAVVVSFPLVLVAALAGLAVRGGVSADVGVPALLWMGTVIAMHLLSFGDPRYHLPMVPVLAVLATGLARATCGLGRVRVAGGLLMLLWLAFAWWSQFGIYLSALLKLATPDGWKSLLSYDDLL